MYLNHIKMNLLIRRSRPGPMVRRKFLQRLPLKKTESLLMKHSVKSHGDSFLMSPGLGQESDAEVEFCRHSSELFLPRPFTLISSSEATILKGNLPAFPVVIGGGSPPLCHELRFLNK